MEQEPESPILYTTVKRVGYKLVLAAHIIFIITAITGAVVLLGALALSALAK